MSREEMSKSLDSHSDLVMNDGDDVATAALLGEKPSSALAVSEPKTGTVATFFIFLKSYLGSGLLGMAAAFLAGGETLRLLNFFFFPSFSVSRCDTDCIDDLWDCHFELFLLCSAFSRARRLD